MLQNLQILCSALGIVTNAYIVGKQTNALENLRESGFKLRQSEFRACAPSTFTKQGFRNLLYH